MSKRRTRAKKIKAQAKKTVLQSISATTVNVASDTHVKSYFKNEFKQSESTINRSDSSVSTEESSGLKLIKRSLIKSLIISSFILCLEVVLYLVWYK